MSGSCSCDRGLCDSKRSRMHNVEEILGMVSWKNDFPFFTVKRISAGDHKKKMKLPEVLLGIRGLWSPASLLVSSQSCLTCRSPRWP